MFRGLFCRCWWGGVVALWLTGCSAPQPEPPQRATLTWLRVGLLPTHDREQLLESYTLLLNFISQEMGVPYRLLLAEDYTDSQRLFGAGMVDLAFFGGMGFVQAQRNFAARPLVMRDVDTRFTSLFLARAGQGDDVSDFRGKRIAFGSENSTSGHLMPRYFLKTILDIEPEGFFEQIHFSGQHDRTALMVQAGEAELGVADSVIVRRMLDEGMLSREKVRILWETPSYPNHVWAVPVGLPDADRQAILRAFLKLSWEEEGHRAILARHGTKGYLPASQSDFAMLARVATSLGLLP